MGSRAWSPVACDCPGVGTIIDPSVPLYQDRIGTGSLARLLVCGLAVEKLGLGVPRESCVFRGVTTHHGLTTADTSESELPALEARRIGVILGEVR